MEKDKLPSEVCINRRKAPGVWLVLTQLHCIENRDFPRTEVTAQINNPQR